MRVAESKRDPKGPVGQSDEIGRAFRREGAISGHASYEIAEGE